VGVIGFPPDRFAFPGTALAIKKSAVVVQGNSVFVSGVKVSGGFSFPSESGELLFSFVCVHPFLVMFLPIAAKPTKRVLT
jgi:hypothetical protein